MTDDSWKLVIIAHTHKHSFVLHSSIGSRIDGSLYYLRPVWLYEYYYCRLLLLLTAEKKDSCQHVSDYEDDDYDCMTNSI